MATTFHRGQEMGPNDLNIFIRDEDNFAADPATITYAIFDFTTGVEILIGDAARVPTKVEVGSYYAAFAVPNNANLGTHRVRWSFKQFVNSDVVEIVQEWDVVAADVQIVSPAYAGTRATLINRLRIMLRDQCVDGDEKIKIRTGNEEYILTVKELWDIVG